MNARQAKIGLALGSGSARGWAHIGVIHALARLGIKPDIVCGSSIGALVGASLACGRLDKLDAWLADLSLRDILKLVDLSITGGGLIQGNKLAQAFYHYVDVNLNSELPGNKARAAGRKSRLALNLPQNELIEKIADTLAPIRERIETILPTDDETDHSPGMFETMNASIDIMQDQITKSRLAGDPPDILITPHLAHLGWLEFDRSGEAIKEGKQAVKRALSAGAFNALLPA